LLAAQRHDVRRQIVAAGEDEMLKGLALYFRGDFSFSLRQPILKLVDEIKSVYPNWPDDWC
jgi:hypothetical protein